MHIYIYIYTCHKLATIYAAIEKRRIKYAIYFLRKRIRCACNDTKALPSIFSQGMITKTQYSAVRYFLTQTINAF